MELVDAFSYYNSFTSLWKQVDVIYNMTKPFFDNATEGAHVIGYSQGMILINSKILSLEIIFNSPYDIPRAINLAIYLILDCLPISFLIDLRI